MKTKSIGENDNIKEKKIYSDGPKLIQIKLYSHLILMGVSRNYRTPPNTILT